MKDIKKAAAIQFDPQDKAPTVIAKGKGIVADKILEKGKEEAIPFHQDETLADELTKLDVGMYIPPELYEVVAEILIFLDNLDDKIKF
ncbi:flagellar biosynthesis protein [Natranaerovirga hydrolytica]|uniref:Flagellar biosynthesis protein n=1 Tax=Natranaerovirga hydrolytica TaxID=680378 RepID=A0A4R1MYD0_9FIRM|nr:EscU/YscU/HrcU family type III secretion system export apparatus switch protein [Natranaerovirga hydrolytica]TCK98298.1 flagellar biosynthesis protein [Natranaerovirga hydrolytica]